MPNPLLLRTASHHRGSIFSRQILAANEACLLAHAFGSALMMLPMPPAPTDLVPLTQACWEDFVSREPLSALQVYETVLGDLFTQIISLQLLLLDGNRQQLSSGFDAPGRDLQNPSRSEEHPCALPAAVRRASTLHTGIGVHFRYYAASAAAPNPAAERAAAAFSSSGTIHEIFLQLLLLLLPDSQL